MVPSTTLHTDERYSAKGFEPKIVPLEWLSRTVETLTMMPMLFRYKAVDLTIFIVVLRVAGLASGVMCATKGADKRLLRLSSTDVSALADHLCRACQGQSLLRECAYAVIVTAPSIEIAQNCGTTYRHTVLNAGFISAWLYRLAAELGFGNTCIGGFSDALTASLIGNPGMHPILVHAFGVARIAGEKGDEVKSGVDFGAPQREL